LCPDSAIAKPAQKDRADQPFKHSLLIDLGATLRYVPQSSDVARVRKVHEFGAMVPQ